MSRTVIPPAPLAVPDADFALFIARLRAAVLALLGPTGLQIAERALHRARKVADIDTIVSRLRY